MEAPIYFWRDQHGHEVDLVVDRGDSPFCIDIKSGQTFQKNFLDSIKWLNNLQNQKNSACIYGGDKIFQVNEIMVHSWKDLSDLF